MTAIGDRVPPAVGPSVIATRERLEQGLLAHFGQTVAAARQEAAAVRSPQLQQLGEARIALEHAVLQTALEKDVSTTRVVAMLERTTPDQVAQLVQQGKQSIERTYGLDAGAMVAALSAHVADLDLPRTMVQTETVRQLVDHGRALTQAAMLDGFQNRGRIDHTNPHALVVTDRQSTAQAELKNHMVFVESAINHAAQKGQLTPDQAHSLKERIEHQVFQVPNDLKVSPQFKQYFQSAGQALRHDTMTEARRVATTKTVSEIAERLDRARQATATFRDRQARDR